jgi:hypothetical protein
MWSRLACVALLVAGCESRPVEFYEDVASDDESGNVPWDLGDDEEWDEGGICANGIHRGLVELHVTELEQMSGCRQVDGDLVVYGGGDYEVVDPLRPLDSLEVVTGAFTIRPPRELESLAGLERLERVASLKVFSHSDTNRLSDLTALRGLTHCGVIELNGLRQLESLDGLESVAHPDSGLKEITLHGLDQLDDVHALHQLQELDSLRLFWLPSLTTLSALNLQRVDRFSLDHVGLTELKEVAQLTGGLESLSVHNCAHLTSISGPTDLTSIERLAIDGCPLLEEATGFDGLIEARFLHFAALPKHSALSFPVLAVAESLDLQGAVGISAPALTKLDAGLSVSELDAPAPLNLGRLERVGSLKVTESPSLGDLDWLSSLRASDGDVHITFNSNLTSAEILELLAGLEVGGEVVVEGNGP